MRLDKNEEGQSSIEFLMSIIFSISIVYLFVNMALNFTKGYLNHYATFMAARTFLSEDAYVISSSGLNNALTYSKNRSQGTFDTFNLSRFRVESTLDFNYPGVVKSPYIGVVSVFKTAMSPFKFIGGGLDLDLKSEAFLGKEPPINDCAKSVCEAIEPLASTVNCNSSGNNITFMTLYDNGC